MELLNSYSKLPYVLDQLRVVRQHLETTKKHGSRRTSGKLHRIHKLEQRLDDATVARLVADYQAGTPSTQLIRRYRLSKGSVLRLLHQHGLAVRSPGLSAHQVTAAVQLYETGWSLQRLGDHFGVDGETVGQALRRLGMQLRGPHDRPRRPS